VQAHNQIRAVILIAPSSEMPAGSVLFWLGGTLHGAGANVSDESRDGIVPTYSAAWLRQEENQYLACPPEVARELPEDLARLAGYRRGAYALGYYGDLHDPFDAVRGESPDGPATFSPVPRS